MSSLICLRADARLSILRGYRLLRSIELERERLEAVELAARQDVAGMLDGDLCDLDDAEWTPTHEEILAACEALQAEWTDEERELRWKFERATPRLKRYYAEAHRLRQDPSDARAYRREYHRQWCAQNRERIREANQRRLASDPRAKEKKAAYDRLYRQLNQFHIKERKELAKDRLNENRRLKAAADREAYNARQREYRAAHRDEINAQAREWRAANPDKVQAYKRREREAATA